MDDGMERTKHGRYGTLYLGAENVQLCMHKHTPRCLPPYCTYTLTVHLHLLGSTLSRRSRASRHGLISTVRSC